MHQSLIILKTFIQIFQDPIPGFFNPCSMSSSFFAFWNVFLTFPPCILFFKYLMCLFPPSHIIIPLFIRYYFIHILPHSHLCSIFEFIVCYRKYGVTLNMCYCIVSEEPGPRLSLSEATDCLSTLSRRRPCVNTPAYICMPIGVAIVYICIGYCILVIL